MRIFVFLLLLISNCCVFFLCVCVYSLDGEPEVLTHIARKYNEIIYSIDEEGGDENAKGSDSELRKKERKKGARERERERANVFVEKEIERERLVESLSCLVF